MRNTFLRRPRNPLARWITFLWAARAVTPRLTLGMAVSSVGQHHAHRGPVRGVHFGTPAQVTLALGVLLGEDVARESLAALDAAAGALPEALGRGALGLQLGHDNNSCFSLAPGACHGSRT